MSTIREFIPISEPSITEIEINYVTDAIKSGWVSSLGKYLDIFEQKFAEFCGTDYALTVSNGTTALHLALLTYGIGPGDEVIIPDFTFVATANVVKYTGAEVVFADINEESLCIDTKNLEALITEKTKVIMPVHIYGHPADMVEINRIAKKHNLIVIEDAAEAHGAELLGKRVGSLGNCGVFSFYGNKIITSGEGGMITTNDKKFYEQAKKLRDHSMDKNKRYWHDQVGYNYRMTNLQAALGVAQLERIDELINKKNDIFETYKRYLTGIEGIKINRTVAEAKNVYWMICLELEKVECEEERNNFILALKEYNIDSRPYFYPVSDMPMYEKAETPVAHKVYKRGINLPSYFGLAETDIEYICSKIISVLEKK